MIVGFFRPYIDHQADRQEIKISDRETDLQASEQEQGRCQLAGFLRLLFLDFFLGTTLVFRFAFHMVRMTGMTS